LLARISQGKFGFDENQPESVTMALCSMTGFARSGGQHEGAQWSWELKSVNGRGLDVKFRLPSGFDVLENKARQQIAQMLQRGNVQVQLAVTRPSTPPTVRINTDLIRSLQASLVENGFVPATAPLDLSALMNIRGVVTVEETIEENGAAALLEPLFAGFETALADLVSMRQAEGMQLRPVLLDRINAIEALTQRADQLPGRKAEAIKARLAAQLAALLGEPNALDPNRLHQEAVLLAGKADIREELDRLVAHCEAARALLQAGGAIGRKLDFLSQEFVREANTLCAKSNDVDLTAIGLDLKAIIEQLREQVQNIE
jgi:uncharacterized protein (TIGR00255 family)